MPRKPKLGKRTITIVVQGRPMAITLHPPTGARKSWYAFLTGLITSRSTGQQDLKDAIVAAEHVARNSGGRSSVRDTFLSDEEFEQIQRVHFGRKTDPAARARADKSLEECLDAISAFKALSRLSQIARATPDDCAVFQRVALTLPRNWRKQHPQSKPTTEHLSANTVLKWSRCLQSAFERANCAAGKKCVRGVVEENKLLTANPWNEFAWIEGTSASVRQFDAGELLNLLGYVEDNWRSVPVASAAVRVFLWSGCRKLEVAGLTWDMLRVVGDEYHFQITGKWGVQRWFPVPEPVYRELLSLRTGSPFVFAAYNDQIRLLHAGNAGCLRKMRPDFTPQNFGRWVYERVKDWAAAHGKEAHLHVFRKTALQHARRGEDVNRRVAEDARVGEAVMMASYVTETGEELRARSNRTFARIVARLPQEVAKRYGCIAASTPTLEQQVQTAITAKDWDRVAALSAKLATERRPGVG
jgi:integrase